MSTSNTRVEHWADRSADEILARQEPVPIVCTGISPSGEFHVGHLREILTGDALTRALRDKGVHARLVFIVDNLDPLRKVYPFLDREVYEPLVGRSLHELPAPSGAGLYDRYFLDPFLGALEALRVDAEILPAHELYGSGRMDDAVFTALEKTQEICQIIGRISGRELPLDWSPWTPRCSGCERLDRGRVTGFDRASAVIRSRCGACETESEQPPSRGGKLTWRVDWPARWSAIGVTAEPFGKDHSSRGGSYDTGVAIARDIFGKEPPHPTIYEWISLKGRGDMSSSRGNVLTVRELIRVVPPEVLRYMVMKSKPSRGISFDPGLPLLRLVDEVDDASARGRDDRALELSRAAGFRNVGVPFKHLVLVAQIAEFDLDRSLEILERGGFRELDRDAVSERLEMAQAWLESYAPPDVKVAVPEELPAAARELEDSQRVFLSRLADALEGLTDAETIHSTIHKLAVLEGGPGARGGFEAIYKALIGRDRGPRAGFFIAVLGSERVAARFREASKLG